jgi:hypothetical protein
MRSTRIRLRSAAFCGALCIALLALTASAGAATVTYPGGGSGFESGLEGWSASDASCSPGALLCSSEAGYDASAGNPAGSIAARTTVTVNLVGLFKGTATWTSPKFTLPVDAITGADVRLDRALDPGGLVDVGPEASYTVTLQDLTSGTSTTALSGQLGDGGEAFASDSAPVAVVGGHTYRLSIEAETAQSTLAVSLLNGTTALRFDNIGLTVSSSVGSGGGSGSGGGGEGGKGGKGSGSGSSSLSDRRLFALLSSGAGASPAVLKGNRLLVKVNCPAKIGHACRVAAQGLLSKHKPATRTRMVKLKKGKGRRVVLAVKPKAREALAKRKRLLVRQRVHADSAHATVYKVRKLIRH